MFYATVAIFQPYNGGKLRKKSVRFLYSIMFRYIVLYYGDLAVFLNRFLVYGHYISQVTHFFISISMFHILKFLYILSRPIISLKFSVSWKAIMYSYYILEI